MAVGGRGRDLIGRKPELAVLLRALEVPADGFRALVIEGRPGIGKTTLWEYALGQAELRSWRVFAARAASAEARLTYVALADLLAGLPDVAYERLPLQLRGALEVALLRARPGRGRLAQRAVAAGFLSLLEGLAEEGPVVVAVDDAQWLDGPSAALLEFAARRLRAQPVLFLLSQRSGDPEPFSYERACAELGRLELGPLDLGELQQLIRAHLDAPLLRRQLLEVERLSGGNPLFALELARAFQGQVDRASGPPPLPSTLGEALLVRIRSLPRPARRSLLVAALAAEPRPGPGDSLGLAQAEAAGVVTVGPDDVVAFTHPLLAWAVERSASMAERRAAHLELAGRVADHEEAIRHRALAADGPDPELAAELERAALAAQARGAPAAATELLADARRLSPASDLDAWTRLVGAEIPLQLEAGDWVQAWALGQEALERLPPGPARAVLLLEAAEHRPGAEELCRQALAEAGDDPSLRIRGELALALQRLYCFDGAGARPHVQTAVELARRFGPPQLLDLAVTHRGILTFLFGDGDPSSDFAEAVAIETELGDRLLPVAMSASCYQALWLMCTGGVDAARTVLQELLGTALDSGDEGSQAQLLSFLGALEMRAGNWTLAREQIESAARLADLMEFAQGSAEKRGWLALLLARQGELEAAEASAAEALALSASIGDRFAQVLVFEARATAAAGLDDAAGVLEQVEQIREILGGRTDPPVWTEFEADELEALVALGRPGEAGERLAGLARRLQARPTPGLAHWVGRGSALLAAAEGDLDGALRALGPALAQEVSTAPFEHARTLLLRGQIERRARHRNAARVSLERAAAMLEGLGARAWVERAATELDRVGRRRTEAGLTATEQRVAELAAHGRTNREIAANLFISRRTVETNLARVYRKLGINSRVELASLLAARSAD